MKAITVTIASAACLFLVACATPYQHLGLGGGFTDKQIAPDTFKIHFRGNGYTPDKRAQDLAVLRAAELTLEHGYQYFTPLNVGSSDRGFVAPITGTVVGNTVIASGGGLYHFPGVDLVIKCSHEKTPGAQDAKYVAWLIRATYDLKS